MAISAESVMSEIAVHLRPRWSEEREEIICLFILHLLKYTRKVLMAQGGIRVLGDGFPLHTETEGHVSLGLEDLKDTGGLMSRHVCYTPRRGNTVGWMAWLATAPVFRRIDDSGMSVQRKRTR